MLLSGLSMKWNKMTDTDDMELLRLIQQKLYTAVIGDILDTLERTQQFLPPVLAPLLPNTRIAGRAMPVIASDVYGPQKKPFGLLTEALDQLEPGEIWMSSALSQPVAQWGEIMTATAIQRGAVGAIVDGYYRDSQQILARNFPVWGLGAYGADSSIRSVVSDFRVPTKIGNVVITPGDLVVADVDGVLVVPKDVEDEVIRLALEKVSSENKVCQEIDNGLSATMAFEKYGVL